MLIQYLGAPTTIIMGVAIGFCGFAILLFWLQIFFKNLDTESKWFWRFFTVHMLFWIIGTCVVSVEWLNRTSDYWTTPALAFYIFSIIVMTISKFRSMK